MMENKDEIHKKYCFAKELLSSGKKLEAYSILEPMAKKGNADAQFILGEAYLYGEGVVTNFDTALSWLNAALNSGCAKAAIILGTIYDVNYKFQDELIEVQRSDLINNLQAQKLYTDGYSTLLEGALKNDLDSMRWVALCHEAGWGVPVNIEEADRWYAKANEIEIKEKGI